MITISPPVNAPGTTIGVASLQLMFGLNDDGRVRLIVQLFDGSGRSIQLPQPVRQMTAAEMTTFLAVTANAGETPLQHLQRAALPYMSAVYGLTYTTV